MQGAGEFTNLYTENAPYGLIIHAFGLTKMDSVSSRLPWRSEMWEELEASDCADLDDTSRVTARTL